MSDRSPNPFVAPPLLVLALIAQSACAKQEPVDSCKVATTAMGVEYKVTSDGTSSTVYAALHVGDWDTNTFVGLCSGDALVVHVGGKDYPLQQNKGDSSDKASYGASLGGVVAGDFVLDYTRASGASAVGNKLSLPPPFMLTGPTGAQSRRSPLTLSWDGAGAGYTITIVIEDSPGNTCIHRFTKSVVGDPGNVTLNGGELVAASGHEKDACPLAITVERGIVVQETAGGFSSEFGHRSRREATQVRRSTLSSVE